ncbi:MAG: PEP-utilizing enzyme [Candidatus Woesearchaeota archaeon]
MKNLDNFKHDDWIVYFSGAKWSLLSLSRWGKLYTRKPFCSGFKSFLNQAIIVWDGEATTCYVRESEKKRFSTAVAKAIQDDPQFVENLIKTFRKHIDNVLHIYKEFMNKNISVDDYKKYKEALDEKYYTLHIQVKNVVDALPADLLGKYLATLEEVRVHAEPVFTQEIIFMQGLAKIHAKKTGYLPEHILSCFDEEFMDNWENGSSLPDQKILAERNKNCVLFFEDGELVEVLVGKDVSHLSSLISTSSSFEMSQDVVKGQSAFEGKVKGIVRIVYDPSNVNEFNEGDILVAPWTRPEYLPLMKKAAAFVTDGGGILSHAAIVARELKKPCVISTKNSTSVFKDGDEVEVDANKGIVRRI